MIEINEIETEEIRRDPDAISWFYWLYISKYSNLSKEFIYEFYDKVDWKVLCMTKSYNFKDAPRHIRLYITLNHRELLEHFK